MMKMELPRNYRKMFQLLNWTTFGLCLFELIDDFMIDEPKTVVHSISKCRFGNLVIYFRWRAVLPHLLMIKWRCTISHYGTPNTLLHFKLFIINLSIFLCHLSPIANLFFTWNVRHFVRNLLNIVIPPISQLNIAMTIYYYWQFNFVILN